jgi:mitogen-activated protein kinase kinase kinase
MATSLRALASQPSHSPTSSISEHSTTPTSPHFAQHAQRVAHPYSSSSSHLDSRLHSTTLASLGPGGSSGTLTRASSIQHPRPPSPPLLRPSPGFTFSQHLKGWGHAEVAQWLAIYKCGHHAPLFQRNDIDGNVLLDVDMASLKEMGIAKVGERVKLLSGIKDLRKRAAAQGSVQPRVELRLNGAATPPLDDVPRLERPREGVAARRLNSGRPPPLDLHNHSARNLPQVYQPMLSATPRQRTTPRPIAQPPARPTLQSQNSSNTTVTQASVSSVPAPSRPNNLNLRAPPPRDPGRRSPSPVNDASSFLDRPLPPAPTGSTQSSAAEYASSIAQSRQNSVSTPTWAQSGQSYGVPKGPAPSSLAERRAASQQSLNAAARTEHRKVPSLGTSSGSKTSPIKNKFAASGLLGRSATPVHPFAASRDDKASPPQVPSKESPPTDYAPTLGHSRTATGGQLSGTTSTIARLPPRKDSATSAAPISLEDLRRQLVKFVNAEDGTMKTVNVSSCVSGVEVLERVLKKFNKCHTGNVSTDTESDEDGERLEVDGWGVYTDDLDPDAGGEYPSPARRALIEIDHAQPSRFPTRRYWASV